MGLVSLVADMLDGENGIIVSHSPWTELAAKDPAAMPYGIGEADATKYEFEDNIIVASAYIPGPLGGGKHT